MAATDIIVPSALGSELNFSLPSSIVSSRSYEARTQPVNAQTFDTAGNVIQIDIPGCGKRGNYLDTSTTYLRFKATYTHGGAVGTDKSWLLGSGGYSYFQKAEVYGNNSVLLESIDYFSVLANMLINIELNGSDKMGMSPAFGAENGSCNVAHAIYDATTTMNSTIFEYSIPILGILGSLTEKFLPIGAFSSLRLEMTLDSFNNYTVAQTASATYKVTGVTISEVEFVGTIVELDNDSQLLIEQANPNKIHIRTQSYKTSTGQLAGGVSGQYDILIGTRVSSLKSMYISCWASNGVDGKFGSISPNLQQGTCLVLNGTNVPQRCVAGCFRTSDMFIELQKSIGGLSNALFNGCLTRNGYNRASTATGVCLAYNTAVGTITSNPNFHYMGFSTEIISHRSGLLTGINTTSSPSFFRAQIASALSAYVHYFYFFSFHDVILEIDPFAKTIVAKF